MEKEAALLTWLRERYAEMRSSVASHYNIPVDTPPDRADPLMDVDAALVPQGIPAGGADVVSHADTLVVADTSLSPVYDVPQVHPPADIAVTSPSTVDHSSEDDDAEPSDDVDPAVDAAVVPSPPPAVSASQLPAPVTPVAPPPVTPVATPPVTPVATPPVTPVATPPVTPVATPPVTPVATPPVTPVATPPVTPVATPPEAFTTKHHFRLSTTGWGVYLDDAGGGHPFLLCGLLIFFIL